MTQSVMWCNHQVKRINIFQNR